MPLTAPLPVLRINDATPVSGSSTDFNIGRHEEMGKAVLPSAHKHDFYLVLVIDKGSGVHKIDFEQYTVKDKMIFFLSVGQAHQWNLAEKTTGYQVMFGAEFLPVGPAKFPYFSASAKPCLSLSPHQFNSLKTELESLKNEFDNEEIFSREVIRLRLQVVMKLLQR